MKAVGWGIGLTALVTVVLALYWGRGAILPGLAFGALATAIEVMALARLRHTWDEPGTGPLKGFAEGMGLRLAGVAVLATAMVIDRTVFPPLPSALGFLGVLVPLLFLEVRWVR
ncbi:MAG TPA: hypothetical protein VLA89_00885 [Gemmatimonadales bacterium]|nr:hypothetical protein [Gemmatimonadales bacterium]